MKLSAANQEPLDKAPLPSEVRPISRAIALARSGCGEWHTVFVLMRDLVGKDVAIRWMRIELELAGLGADRSQVRRAASA